MNWKIRALLFYKPVARPVEYTSYSPTNRSLRENVSIERAQRQADICLRETKLYSSLFELFGKLLQVLAVRLLLAVVHLVYIRAGCRVVTRDQIVVRETDGRIAQVMMVVVCKSVA